MTDFLTWFMQLFSAIWNSFWSLSIGPFTLGGILLSFILIRIMVWLIFSNGRSGD